MVLKVLHYDAFTDTPGMGNPAGIVLNADNLSEKQMQSVAAAAGYNETAFVLSSDKADICLRFFTPGHEMDLCGHATVASVYMMKEHGILKKDEILVETNAGILPVSATNIDDHIIVGMQQAQYREEIFTGSLSNLAHSIGLSENDIDCRFPVVFGSTGIWTLILPIKHISAFGNMKPKNSCFPEILFQKPHSSVHPFCLETLHPEADMHGRHFSSPLSGTVEDPVTGTASGVMGAYYQKHILDSGNSKKIIIVEQGQDIGKDGIIKVELPTKKEDAVKIYGTAVFVKEFFVREQST
jgi:PhzF family phenazine biosynthesis protein